MRILHFLRSARITQTIVYPILSLAVLSWASVDLQAQAYAVTFTAEELLAEASFPTPTRQPTLVGTSPNTSLYFGPAAPDGERYEKLLELPLFPAGTFSSTETVTVSIIINHTWVPNSAGPGDPNDWDPHLMLGDGNHLAGVTILNQGGADLATCTDANVIPDQGVEYEGLIAGDLGFLVPQLNQPYDVSIVWTLDTSTNVEVEYLNASGARNSSNVALDKTRPLSFVFLSDNQLHEEYQINSVSILFEAEPLTCNCPTPNLFDPPMDRDVTAKKGNRVLPLKFTLCDEEGFPVTDMDILSAPMAQVMYLEADPDVNFSDEILTAGHGDNGNSFVFTGGHWQLNLQTKRFDAEGVYEITVVPTDPSYVIFPTCSVRFKIE